MITDQGIQPDLNKVSAINNMKSPDSVKSLKSFLGMVTYLSKFIPNLADNTKILRDLLKKGVLWDWSPNHEDAFNNLKYIISKAPTLRYYNNKIPIKI